MRVGVHNPNAMRDKPQSLRRSVVLLALSALLMGAASVHGQSRHGAGQPSAASSAPGAVMPSLRAAPLAALDPEYAGYLPTLGPIGLSLNVPAFPFDRGRLVALHRPSLKELQDVGDVPGADAGNAVPTLDNIAGVDGPAPEEPTVVAKAASKPAPPSERPLNADDVFGWLTAPTPKGDVTIAVPFTSPNAGTPPPPVQSQAVFERR